MPQCLFTGIRSVALSSTRRCISLLVFAHACTGAAAAQPDRFAVEHIAGEQGLSHNTVVSIFQDSRGFVWIGTIDGLNRYDGYSCFVFRNNPSDSNSISSSFIHGVIEDVDGKLWIGTRNGGLSRFDPATGTFRKYLQPATDETLLTGRTVGPLLLDSKKTLLVGTENGLGRYDGKSDSFKKIPIHGRIATDDLSLAALEPATDTTFWMLTEKTLYVFDPSSGKLQQFRPPLPANNFYHGLLVDNQQNLWVGSNSSGVFRLDIEGRKWKHYPARPESGKGVSSVYASPKYLDDDGRIWFTTQNGLDVFDPSTEHFTHIRHIEGNQSTISSNNVSAVMRDVHGDIWVGTWGGGVDKMITSRMKFPLLASPSMLTSKFVLSVLEDQRGDLWVGTGSGVDRILREKNIATASTSIDATAGTVTWCMLEGPSGELWFGTDRKGIIVLDSSRHRQTAIRHNPADAGSLPENRVRALFRDSRGRIWAGLQTKGVAWYNPDDRSWNVLPSGSRGRRSVSDVLIWAINEDNDGNIWFGSYVGGLNKLNLATEEITYYQHQQGDTTSLPVNDVRGITVTRAGEMWIATYGGGICRYNPASDSFTRFTERDGLANNFTYGILEDNEGELWITTNKGLARFSPLEKRFRTYTSRDGLQSDEFNTGAYFKSRTGELFVGGIGGLNCFYPARIKGSTRIPPVMLTSFKIFDRELLGARLLAANDTITLKHSDNFFSFEFAALDYVDPSRNEYMYRLEGFDSDWVRSGTRRYASYTNLDPGDYTLRIRGANSDGVWNNEGARVYVSIVPPFWQRWWFRGTVVVLLIAVFGWLVRYASTRKLRRQLRELEKERALQNERERISRDLHDNAGAQLASIIAGLEIAEKYVEVSGSKTKELIDSLRDDARSSMMRLRETIWALKTNAMTAEEFADAVRTFAERQLKYRSATEIRVVNRLTNGLRLSPNQVLNLFRIVQESITNALKHADARLIEIVIEKKDCMLLLSVRDDGKGSSGETDLFSGKGMLNMQSRTNELGGSFRFLSDATAGCVVEVEVPIAPNRRQHGS